MDWTTFLQNTVPVITVLIWIWSRIDKKFDAVMDEIKEMKKDINAINVQIGKLETRVEERTLRVVHTQRTGTEKDEI